ncbi:hypothetical protein TNIN_27071 [Trichonephila inaurata madagascariensis]|uniref:Uncharacterized protein n=1 Tax=Trichonephila inaurata madagascariensis TaxID=2747483 RepID=A0A8X7C0P3_9ARAC|nr:hypothetical protein TNIN_27071 [Trichonephila inaurata madagascariensis]
MANIIKTRGEPHQDLHRRIKAFSSAGSTVTHTQSPNARISVPIAYLLHVNGALELCHQRPGTAFVRDKLLDSDLYQEFRQKAKNSFRSKEWAP